MRYLIPVDAKPHTQFSIELALRVFDIKGKDITLLHILKEPEPSQLLQDPTGISIEDYMEQEAEKAEKLLDSIGAPLEKAGANVIKSVVPGFVAATIQTIQIADSIGITILSPAEHTAQELMLQGSITQQLLAFDYHGTLVRARELTRETSELGAVFFFEAEEDLHTIEKIAPLLDANIKILAVTPDPSAVFMPPQPGSHTGSAVASQVKPEEVLKAAAKEFQRLGRKHEELVLQTRFRDWLTAYMRGTDVGMLVIPRERDAQTTRSAFGTPREEIFFKAPCPTALCRYSG